MSPSSNARDCCLESQNEGWILPELGDWSAECGKQTLSFVGGEQAVTSKNFVLVFISCLCQWPFFHLFSIFFRPFFDLFHLFSTFFPFFDFFHYDPAHSSVNFLFIFDLKFEFFQNHYMMYVLEWWNNLNLRCTGCKLIFWTKLILHWHSRMLAHFGGQWLVW